MILTPKPWFDSQNHPTHSTMGETQSNNIGDDEKVFYVISLTHAVLCHFTFTAIAATLDQQPGRWN